MVQLESRLDKHVQLLFTHIRYITSLKVNYFKYAAFDLFMNFLYYVREGQRQQQHKAFIMLSHKLTTLMQF